jgi:hypothetical protein
MDDWTDGWMDDGTDEWNDASRRPLLYVMFHYDSHELINFEQTKEIFFSISSL